MITFLFVHVTWVFFRAKNMEDAIAVVRKLIPGATDFGAIATVLPVRLEIGLPFVAPSLGVLLTIAAVLVLTPVNSDRLARQFSGRAWESGFAALLLALGVLTLGQVSQFLYFNF
jgi:hypothetical protein